MTSPDIQKEIANAAAVETINAIIKDIGDSLFAIIVDESRDMSTKEQLAIALRYVDKLGHVNERFLGITHVNNTSAVTLKSAIEEVFNKHSLSISRLRGQGYDGASNMRVAVAKNHIQIATFFNLVAKVFNIVGASCKRRDILREKRNAEVIEALKNNEISTGRGLNQEMSLKRPGDTRWSSHYGALVNLIHMFSSVIDVIETIIEDGVLGISNELSQALQRKDQDIVNAMKLVDISKQRLQVMRDDGWNTLLEEALQRKDQDIVNAMKLVDISKQRLQVMRDDGWNTLLEEVSAFCAKNNIDVPDMDDLYQPRPRRKAQNMKNSHHYQVELFYTVIDMQLQELNSRFENSELLICVACLNPDNLFSAFNKEKLIRLAQFYPSDFSTVQVSFLDNQLETYIHDMRSTEEFLALKGIGQLAEKMVEMKKNVSYPLVYSLVTLALILPVATTTVERAFSAMNIIKNRLRNRIGDQWMSDCLVTYIEKDIFKTIDCEEIMQRFQNMKNRRGQLSKTS
ncbi:uncharacterized protein LOC136068063 [Quercus suber]|uniref:uncharacterized protein LOC136068063 n=1 Tax=Quercus suber TaxID=58331 RepID=UPI0032DF026C